VGSDNIGRPVFATNQNGTKVWAARYLPFGQVQTSGGDNIALRFPGQWFTSMAGFHQNWMRDYDPTLGRYIQADPLGLVDGASVYNYALQNPNRYTDPRGLTVKPGHSDYEYCKSLERRMDNLRKKIRERDQDLIDDPRKLPERAPGQSLRHSKHGHRILINKDWNQLRKLEDEYDKRCGGGDCGGGTGAAVPVLPPVVSPGNLIKRLGGGRYRATVPLGPLIQF